MTQLLSIVLLAVVFIYTIESVTVKTPTTAGGGGGRACSPVNCRGKTKVCPYGYQKLNGCEICKCNDPCNPPGKKLCGSHERCHVDKKADGTFSTRCDAAPARKGKGDKGGKAANGASSVSKADCNQPKQVGMCRASLPRFYYNSATKNCETFSYGGCGGNANNFQSKVQCEKACKA